VRCAPKFQEANFGSELKRPYIVPPRVRYMIGEQGKNGQEIFCSIELLDASGGVLDDFEFRVRTDTEIDIDGSNNTVVEADGFLTYPYFGPVSSDAAYVEMAFRVEGGPELKFFIDFIVDSETSNLPAPYKHQRDRNGFEVSGDAFGSINGNDIDEVFSDLRPDEKDLVIELDLLASDPWFSANASLIVDRLQDVFESADINLHVYVDYIPDYDVPPTTDRGECKEILATQRNSTYLRKALHVVVVNQWGGPIDPGNVAYGMTIQYFGSAVEHGIIHGDGLWEYQCAGRLESAYPAVLDSVGCVIFWDSFLNLHNNQLFGPGWDLLEAFCHNVAHEIGHAIGMWRITERQDGSIMSHQTDYTVLQRNHDMEFWGQNLDNMYSGESSSEAKLTSVLGVRTISQVSGWLPADPNQF
jgi:hypothetical protein